MKVAIFHGWGANSQSNWFPWLKNELEKEGHEVYLVNMPNTNNPILEEWISKAHEFNIDENTILVGHSLGTILSMRLMEKIKIKSAFLVSAFDKDLEIDELKNFFEKEFDYKKIKENSGRIVILNSDNDPHISVDISKRLQNSLNCSLILFEGMNHLNEGTDNFKFPELLTMIKNDIS